MLRLVGRWNWFVDVQVVVDVQYVKCLAVAPDAVDQSLWVTPVLMHGQRNGALADRTGQSGGLRQPSAHIPLECDIAECVPRIVIAHLGDHMYNAYPLDGDRSVL